MSHATPARVALLGCGDIAGQYLAELERRPSVLEVTTCADLDIGRARARPPRRCTCSKP